MSQEQHQTVEVIVNSSPTHTCKKTKKGQLHLRMFLMIQENVLILLSFDY